MTCSNRVPAGEWQVVKDAGGIRLLVSRPGADFDGAAVLAQVARALETAGASLPGLNWAEVDAIPRTATGKTPLIRAATNHPPDAGPHEPL
jgi:hypothetical protein